jgi:hypothetical protein
MFKAEHPDFDFPSSYAKGDFEDPSLRRYETAVGMPSNLLQSRPSKYQLRTDPILAPAHYSRNVGVGKSHPPKYHSSILHPELFKLDVKEPELDPEGGVKSRFQKDFESLINQPLGRAGRLVMQNGLGQANNPILGGSEGQQRHQVYTQDYKDYAHSVNQGSLIS